MNSDELLRGKKLKLMFKELLLEAFMMRHDKISFTFWGARFLKKTLILILEL